MCACACSQSHTPIWPCVTATRDMTKAERVALSRETQWVQWSSALFYSYPGGDAPIGAPQ